MMDGRDVFVRSRALKSISTTTKTYVRDVADILRVVINPQGAPHPFQSFEYDKAGSVKRCEYRTFTAYLDDWSRLTLAQLRDLFHNDAEITNLLDVATQGRHGGDRSKTDNIKDAQAPDGTSKAAGLRRLRKDRPDLHERVLSGDMTTHAAMLEAGFRKPSITLQPNNAPRAAERIREVLGDNFADQLKEAL